MEKSIIILRVNGLSAPLNKIPTFNEMREIVGGWIEMVKVLPLDALSVSSRHMTYMICHEEGRLLNLPRNKKATEIYHNLTRKQFPQADDPFKSAKEAFLASMPEGTHVITSSYEDEPFIAGDVIYFQGYTCTELDSLWNREEGE